MTKIDSVWLGAAILTYDVCSDNKNWQLEDIYFGQQEIVSKAKQIIGDDIPNALVSQHACAYSNSSNKNNMYLVANGAKRRISYIDEFAGKITIPDFSEMKNNISVQTKHGTIDIDALSSFVKDTYTPRIIQLLEKYFSKYDLESVIDFLRNYEGRSFVAVEKAGEKAGEMEIYKSVGASARNCVKNFSEEISVMMPRYEKIDVSGWINQGQKTSGYLWAQLRKKTKELFPSSLSVSFIRLRFEGKEDAYYLMVIVDTQDTKCIDDEISSSADKYYQHARLLQIDKKKDLDYYMTSQNKGETVIVDKTANQILSQIESSDNKKIQIGKVITEEEIKTKSAYEVFRFMADTIFELEPYYDAAVANANVTSENFWPSLDDYNPGISAEVYEKILSDKSIIQPTTLDTIYRLYLMGGVGSCKQLEENYGNTAQHYNSDAMNTGKIVHEHTNCPLRIRDDGSNSYWPVLFLGRGAEKEETGTFVWKLRDPLYDAIKSMIAKGVFSLLEVGEKNEMNEEAHFNPNMILYGPPGTGKTYNTVIYAVAICDEKSLKEVSAKKYDDVKKRYDELVEEKRIAFTTFHQSYGYEEFIEGIRPVVDENDDDCELTYTIKPGVFKEFCDRAKDKNIEMTIDSPSISSDSKVWKVSIAGSGMHPVKRDCFNNNRIRIGWPNRDHNITDESECNSAKERRILTDFEYRMSKGDIVLILKDQFTIDGIGVIEGDYEWLEDGKEFPRSRKVKWLAKDISENIKGINNGKALTSATVYELGISLEEVIKLINKNDTSDQYQVEENNKKYVFIIDEINRGNISKIFGELITLIEDTKRKGKPEEASAILPYSGKSFSVPSNVYILGTMNTADRSIALMDTALRRRFSFVEKMPDSSVLDGIVVNYGNMSVNIAKMLQTINDRIEFLFDREHTIGHAFFMGLKTNPSVGKLEDIFKKSVVPLLQEYFYEDYEKIQLVLGDNEKTEERYKFVTKENVAPKTLFKGHSHLDKQDKYSINSNAFQWIESYAQIMNDENAE